MKKRFSILLLSLFRVPTALSGAGLGSLAAVLLASALVPRAFAEPVPPKLTVLISVDGCRYDLLPRFRSLFVEGGFRFLLERGANLTECRLDHIRPSTGPGHTTMVTGAYGAVSGIIDNEWWDRDLQRNVNCVEDTEVEILDGGLGLKRATSEGRSPKNLLVTAVGDELRLSNQFQSKVIGISMKDRAAILTAGKTATAAYWFEHLSGRFVSSTHYMAELPPWVTAFNDRRDPDAYFQAQWDRLLPESAYRLSRRDDYPHETQYRGLGRTFPHPIHGGLDKPGQAFYEAFGAIPHADRHLLEFAKQVIDQEGLGRDEIPDILTLGFSATDRVGHIFGPFSQEMQDQILRLDRVLRDLFVYLDARVGLSNTLIALTADHGSVAVPEYLAELNLEAGRIDPKVEGGHESGDRIKQVADEALDRRFGSADWVRAFSSPDLWLNDRVIAERGLDSGLVQQTAADALRSLRGIRQTLTRAEILDGTFPQDALTIKSAHQFHRERSGDVLIVFDPYFLMGGYDGTPDQGSSHETGYDYDCHIPLLVFGESIRPGVYRMPVILNDLAPTLASLLQVAVPAASSGRVIHEIFK